MELQQENAQLQKEITNLETQIVDLKFQLKANNMNSNSTTSIEQEMKMDIGRAAKFFHIFMSLSVPVEAFMVDKPTFPYDSMSAMRMVKRSMGLWLSYTIQFQKSV